jgi:aminopeptidase N
MVRLCQQSLFFAALPKRGRHFCLVLKAYPKRGCIYTSSRMRPLRLFPLLIVLSTVSFAAAPSGIPRELARERAALVSDLHYHLQFTLIPHASSTSGHADILFQLKSATAPLLIDYREGTASKLQINGSAVPVVAENGHIVLPQDKLRTGENKLSIDFVSPVAPAGKAITRFEDKDDGNEYIYTLFVPMDASMAFPCFDQPDLKGRFSLEVTVPMGWTVISNTNSGADSSSHIRMEFA